MKSISAVSVSLVLSSWMSACGDSTPATTNTPQPAGFSAAGAVDGGDCAQPTGAGTAHSSNITADEVWTAAGSPHRVTYGIRVDSRATLTLEECAVVELAKGVSIDVGSSTTPGKLVTRGNYVPMTVTSDARITPVVFKSAVAGEHWGSIFVYANGDVELNATVLADGGDVDAVSATIVARGPNDGTAVRTITPNLLIVARSGGIGVSLENGAGFREPTQAWGGLVVLGAGSQPKPTTWNQSYDPFYPVVVTPPGVGTLPEGTYRGAVGADLVPPARLAANDMILVRGTGAFSVDETFHDRGVPYRMQTELYMRPTTSAKLTIDPGVTLRFYKAPGSSSALGMLLGDYNTANDHRQVLLDIQGTADKPIVFTSDAAVPAAGDWTGLMLDASPAVGNQLTHARIEYAGGFSGTSGYGCGPGKNDSAILITNWRPDDAFIQAVAISDSAGGGIVSGWTSDLVGPDLKTGNTFTNIANDCDVSVNRLQTASDYCPGRTELAPLCY
jgi:hypothetical protein